MAALNCLRMWSYIKEYHYDKWANMTQNHEGVFPTTSVFKYAFKIQEDDDQKIISYKKRIFLFMRVSGIFLTLLITTVLIIGSQLAHTAS